MFTGTLISDLIKTAERVSNVTERQIKEELHEIFTMQIAIENGNGVYQGAA